MEVNGRKVKLSIWVSQPSRSCLQTLNILQGYGGTRTFSDDHVFVLPWCTRYNSRSVPPANKKLVAKGKQVYDVANRETFDALPKWFTEIDTYVSTTVPKIIVGNKLDKVCALRLRYAVSER